ncbi:MAG: amidohydrolase [Rhizobiaceae bacterium]|nr:amidohydrolase [Rhizobiaceae bacterium]
MSLTNQDIADLVAFRRQLHQKPEISNEEYETAKAVETLLAPTGPDDIITGLGGPGLAVVYGSGKPGPTILLRAELDALPIAEISDLPHRSAIPGKGHMCGHDGHTAIVAAVGRQLGRKRPANGRVVLMFQPAEETGNGAAGVIADPRYARIAPDFAFSLHNLPGTPLGHVRLKEGVVNCASRGMRIALTGKTAHSSMPETGVSPMAAISALMPALTDLSQAGFDSDDFRLVTVGHCHMGEAVFGVAPGYAEVWATLRTRLDGRMDALVAAAEKLAREAASTHGLICEIDYHEIFVASLNDAEATAHLQAALEAEGISHDENELPMRASEDFGRFGHGAKSAMLFLGSGESHPQLHNPDYDFPDDLIPIGSRIFMRAVRNLLG